MTLVRGLALTSGLLGLLMMVLPITIDSSESWWLVQLPMQMVSREPLTAMLAAATFLTILLALVGTVIELALAARSQGPWSTPASRWAPRS